MFDTLQRGRIPGPARSRSFWTYSAQDLATKHTPLPQRSEFGPAQERDRSFAMPRAMNVSWTMGRRTKTPPKDDTPGPGAYETKRAQRLTERRRAGPRLGLSPRFPVERPLERAVLLFL